MQVFMYILFALPKRLLSRSFGKIMDIRLPLFLRGLVIGCFARLYNISLEESENPLASYRSIGEFFVRRLKKGIRPVADSTMVHPADAKISQGAYVASGELVQAKGKTYRLLDFLGSEDYVAQLQKPWFLTYYLCPTDYHRVHSPISGRLVSVNYIPGNLWPVNEWSVSTIDELFSVNERVVVEMEVGGKRMFVVLVGATNVGKMSLSFDSEFVTNQSKKSDPIYKTYEGISLEKGQELGCFHMGSTVVLVADEAFSLDPERYKGQVTRIGGPLF